MCGIVGLFLKDKSMEAQLGAMLTDMLITMTDRGPDSAGIAIYSKESKNIGKLTVQSDTPNVDFKQLKDALKQLIEGDIDIRVQSTHAVLEMRADHVESAQRASNELRRQPRDLQRGGAPKRRSITF